MPTPIQDEPKKALTLHQFRTLHGLAQMKGPTIRTKLAEKLGYVNPPDVNEAIGTDSSDARTTKNAGKTYIGHSLLYQGFVREVEIDDAGVTKRGIIITPEGRKAYEREKACYPNGEPPPLRPLKLPSEAEPASEPD